MPTTAVITQGPSGEGFQGIFKTGIDLPLFYGQASFTGTETTCLIPCRGGGLINVAYASFDLVAQNENLRWTVDANGNITVTRTDTTSGASFCFFIVYN